MKISTDQKLTYSTPFGVEETITLDELFKAEAAERRKLQDISGRLNDLERKIQTLAANAGEPTATEEGILPDIETALRFLESRLS